MDEYLATLCRERGCFLRREALALGYQDRTITRLTRVGSWIRVRHGAYTLPQFWDQADDVERFTIRSRAAFWTAGTDVALSHASSIAMHQTDSWALDLSRIHLTRLDRRTGRRESGITQHRGVVLPEDLVYDGELAHTCATRAALEMTMVTDVERSLVVVNGLLHSGRTTRQALLNRYVDMEFWPHTLTTDLVLRLCDDRFESVLESRASYLFFRHQLPQPIPQYAVRDASGQVVARLDFAWPEWGLWAEADGAVKYAQPWGADHNAATAVMREKAREELVRDLTGWTCMRFTWADLSNPDRLVARIRRGMARANGRTLIV